VKCLKCGKDSFDKNVVLANTAEYKFEVLGCKNCSLTQWYDYFIIHKEKKPRIPKVTHHMQLPSFQCLNCKSNTSETIQAISRRGDFLGEDLYYWAGEFIFRFCKKCGLSEMHSVLITDPSRHNVELKRRIKLAESFSCPLCESNKVNKTGEIRFIQELQKMPKDREQADISFLFVVCEKCKYVMFFNS